MQADDAVLKAAAEVVDDELDHMLTGLLTGLHTELVKLNALLERERST